MNFPAITQEELRIKRGLECWDYKLMIGDQHRTQDISSQSIHSSSRLGFVLDWVLNFIAKIVVLIVKICDFLGF